MTVKFVLMQLLLYMMNKIETKFNRLVKKEWSELWKKTQKK